MKADRQRSVSCSAKLITCETSDGSKFNKWVCDEKECEDRLNESDYRKQNVEIFLIGKIKMNCTKTHYSYSFK